MVKTVLCVWCEITGTLELTQSPECSSALLVRDRQVCTFISSSHEVFFRTGNVIHSSKARQCMSCKYMLCCHRMGWVREESPSLGFHPPATGRDTFHHPRALWAPSSLVLAFSYLINKYSVSFKFFTPHIQTFSCAVITALLSFPFRYDEWVKADRIIWPVEKGGPKRKQKKKTKVMLSISLL